MMKRVLSVVLAGLLAQAQAAAATLPPATTQAAPEAQLLEKMHNKIARLGVGERARTTIWLKDGTKIKGYISQARETDVVIRDRKTDAPTPVAYQDIARVDNNRGHGTAKAIAIGAAVGVGTLLAIIAVAIATIDD